MEQGYSDGAEDLSSWNSSNTLWEGSEGKFYERVNGFWFDRESVSGNKSQDLKKRSHTHWTRLRTLKSLFCHKGILKKVHVGQLLNAVKTVEPSLTALLQQITSE